MSIWGRRQCHREWPFNFWLKLFVNSCQGVNGNLICSIEPLLYAGDSERLRGAAIQSSPSEAECDHDQSRGYVCIRLSGKGELLIKSDKVFSTITLDSAGKGGALWKPSSFLVNYLTLGNVVSF